MKVKFLITTCSILLFNIGLYSQEDLTLVKLDDCSIPVGKFSSDRFNTVGGTTPEGHMMELNSIIQITNDRDFIFLKNSIFTWSFKIDKSTIEGFYNSDGQLSFINFYATDKEGSSYISLKGTKILDNFMLFSIKIYDITTEKQYFEYYCEWGNSVLNYQKLGCE